MKVKCSKDELFNGLQQIQNIVSNKTTLPILSNVLLETHEGNLTLTSTDLEVGMKLSVPAKIDKKGITTLPAKKMFSIVRELIEDEIELTVDNHVSIINSGSAFFKVIGLPEIDFPTLPKIDSKLKIELDQYELKVLLRNTSFAVSKDSTRYVLNGVLFSFHDNKLIAVGTDGRRLAYMEKEMNLGGVDEDIIIPTKAVAELMRLLKDEEKVEIYILENQVAFKINNTLLMSRLIEGRFPNYKQIIPDKLKINISLNREELLSSVRRVAVMTTDRSNSIKIELVENNMVITAQSPDFGEAKEEIPVSFQGENVSISFNPVYLIDALRNLEDENIVFSLNDALSPGVISNDDSFQYVIMPMRVA